MPRATRFPVILPLRYRTQGEIEWSYGMTIDISSSGVLFRADHVLDLQAPVEIEVIFPGDIDGSARVVSRGTVKRTVITADPAHEEFMAASFEDYDFVRVPREAVH